MSKKPARTSNGQHAGINDDIGEEMRLRLYRMQFEIRNNRDVWAGAMLIATGATSVIIARDYPFGSSLRMGPGYFPSVLGGLLILFGLYLVAQGLRSNEKIEGNWSLRALIVLIGVAAIVRLIVD